MWVTRLCLYGGVLYCLMIRFCMVICNKASRAVFLFIIGRDGLLWPRGGGLGIMRRNGSGSVVLACMIGCVSMVNQVLA